MMTQWGTFIINGTERVIVTQLVRSPGAYLMPPSAATGSTTNPANPTNPPASAAGSASSADPARPTSGAVGTSGSTDPTASMTPTDRGNATAAVSNADAQKELDAIDAILAKSKTGTLTKAQTTELKKHVENLRALLNR